MPQRAPGQGVKLGERPGAKTPDLSSDRARKYQPACKPGSVGPRPLARTRRDGHSSGAMFAHRLKQPTRTADPTRSRGVIAYANPPLRRPYSVLLPVWFALPPPLPAARCALTAPFHPYSREPRRASAGGSFSVALSLGSPPPDVIRHRVSMEPGLSSPAAFRRLPERPSGRLTLHPCGLGGDPSSGTGCDAGYEAAASDFEPGRAASSACKVCIVDGSLMPSTRCGRKCRWNAVTTSRVGTP